MRKEVITCDVCNKEQNKEEKLALRKVTFNVVSPGQCRADLILDDVCPDCQTKLRNKIDEVLTNVPS